MKKPGFAPIIAAVILGIAVFVLIFVVIIYQFQKPGAGMKSETGRSDPGTTVIANISGDKYDCGATKVPKEYMPWVEAAANKYLKGDKNLLLALISVENNSWNAKSINSASGAMGLGQFVYRTAVGFTAKGRSFNGLNIYNIREVVGTPITSVIKATFLKHPQYSREGRIQPGPALMATAEYFGGMMKRYNGDIFNSYAKGYHKYSNASQQAEAETGAQRLVNNYNTIKNSKCTAGTSSSIGATTTLANGSKVAVIPSNVVLKHPKNNLAHPTLGKKLGQLASNLSGWRVTEAYPPTSQHQDKNHSNGRAVDIALTGTVTEARISALLSAAKAIGFDDILDEYHTKTKYTTAGHIHLEWHGN